MFDNFLLPTLVVFCYSIVQSLFGVGLLVFGTPTLLLLGYSFHHTLSLLLPCSLTISILQLVPNWNELGNFKREFSIITLPPMILTLGTVLLVDVQLGIHILVGSMLILSAATRISPNFAHRFKVLLEKNGRAYLLILGLVHGASNMGGALITIYAASLFRTKVLIRANIGFAYSVLAAIQILVLLLLGYFSYSLLTLALIALSSLSYWAIGNRIFHFVHHRSYHHLMTAMMLVFGITLILTRLIQAYSR